MDGQIPECIKQVKALILSKSIDYTSSANIQLLH